MTRAIDVVGEDPSYLGFPVAAGPAPERSALQHTLHEMGVELSPSTFEIAFLRVRQVTDRWGSISEAQIHSIVADVESSAEIFRGVAESFR